MPPADSYEEALEWFGRAERDLTAARKLLRLAEPLTDIVVFHAHQAAEKALKAFLVRNRTPFSRTHELPALLAECRRLNKDFNRLKAAADTLNPYATRFRYPQLGMPLAPPLEEARAAVDLARDVFVFVQHRIDPQTG